MTAWNVGAGRRAVFVGLLTSMLSGCGTAYGGAPLAPVAAERYARRGLEIAPPDAVVDGAGLRFHGWVCRRPPANAALRAVQLERVGADGQVVEVAYGRVNLRSAGAARCTPYDIATDWALGAAESVRVCPAAATKAPCPATPGTRRGATSP